MIELLDISERRACRYAGLSRTSDREPPSMDLATQELSERIVELAHTRRRFGYRRIHDLLTQEGHEVNHKRVWRLYKMNELSVRKRRKAKRVHLERVPLQASRHVNDTWSADFVMDALANGRRIKCLTVVDDFSRECVDIAIDYGMGGQYVTRMLDAVGPVPRLPQSHPHRPRAGVHQPGLHGLGPCKRCQAPDQRRRQAHAERLHRELQREVSRRVPKRSLPQ